MRKLLLVVSVIAVLFVTVPVEAQNPPLKPTVIGALLPTPPGVPTVVVATVPTVDDWKSAMGDIAIGATVVASALAFGRANIKFLADLKGLAVILASLGIGLIGGLIGQYLYAMTIEPFAGLGKPLGGLAYGLVCGLGASFSVDLIRSLLRLNGKPGVVLAGVSGLPYTGGYDSPSSNPNRNLSGK